ncbi:hypothetical protein FOM00_29160 [Pseudomonas sp. ST1]|uniref:DUF7002 family protein n=1 Tax=Pseudomonas TaxID=286 RepID=UPI0004E0C0E9|nr:MULTISPECIES: hypothetical protein [Pseudomonas]KAA3532558.1 hypothetical protein DXU85_29280 [Pseudomonas savastanoi]RMN34736.1 hypothetical protein ALQ61_04230 [Pseudomonas coronafaciens pv. zizaniae]RMS08255.1 hypothetical protein ALP72_00623 [Pseudomonas coronafaciens pv. coronafaciens]TSC24710.1 hypothetical protein FOM00_29160 [Pseudomonas sp. ST1]
MDLDRLIELYPRIYHMAECGAWDSIRTRGLMSATAVLDHLAVGDGERARFESEHRSEKMDVRAGHPSNIVLRDQKPMPEGRLMQALTDGTTPREWYELINHKVFFWAEEARLHRLLGARDYRRLEHDVLTLDSSAFIPAYADAIWLCHMNSGNTWPMPHRRGTEIFRRIPDYPVKRSGNPDKNVVELVVDYAVPDIANFVLEVRRMRGSEVLGVIA